MNILTDPLPIEIEIDGEFYPIDADFRNCLAIMEMCEDPALTNYDKHILIIKLLYDVVPANINQADKKAIEFLNCGEELRACKEGQLYSFSRDSQYIRSAIEKTHRIDLEAVDFLHWWKFKYLFFDLDESCFFNQLVDLRRRKKRGVLTKEERAYVSENSHLFEFPSSTTVPEDHDEFMMKYKQAKERIGR